jgi:hypothetical protein
MTEAAPPAAPAQNGSSWGERAGALLLLALALGLLFISADILSGGKLTCGGDCDDTVDAGA